MSLWIICFFSKCTDAKFCVSTFNYQLLTLNFQLIKQFLHSPYCIWQCQHNDEVVGFNLEVGQGDETFVEAGDAAYHCTLWDVEFADGFSGDSRAGAYLELHNVGVYAAEAFHRRDRGAKGIAHHVACCDEFLVEDAVDADVL